MVATSYDIAFNLYHVVNIGNKLTSQPSIARLPNIVLGDLPW